MWVYDYKKDAVCHVRWAAELSLLCEIHSNPSALEADQGLHRAELPRGVSHRCHHVSRCDLTAGMSQGSPTYPHYTKIDTFNHTFKYEGRQPIQKTPTVLTKGIQSDA